MKSILVRIVPVALLLAAFVPPARADIIFNAVETGGNVVISGGGTADLTALSLVASGAGSAGMISKDANFLMASGSFESYGGISGPTAVGTTGFQEASRSSGDAIGVNGFTGRLRLPVGYVSGTNIAASMTFDNATFASLGFTPGTYTWTWGSGGQADSLTLNIGSQAVPEPGSLTCCGVLGLLGFVAQRQRRNFAAV